MAIPIPYCIGYQDGQFLTAQTMQTEADYFSDWITLQNQGLYNPGWLMGLDVSVGTGNTLVVQPGTGIDSLGHFLILPGTGGVYTVPSSSQNPCYLTLNYPTIDRAMANAPAQRVNMSAVLGLAATLLPPASGIVLAEISFDRNTIRSVTDRRTPVTSRIQSSPPAAGGSAREVAEPPAMVPRQGTVEVTPELLQQLRAPGDHVEMTVYYVGADVPAFTVPPRVVATVRGPRPFALRVDKVDTVSFALGVTAVIATEPPDRVAIDWMAITV